MNSNGVQRTSIQLYRDCLRLIRHVAPGAVNPKAVALRATVRQSFASRRDETDPDRIADYKLDAVRALSNYLLATAARGDPKVKSAMKDFHGRAVAEAKEEDKKRKS